MYTTLNEAPNIEYNNVTFQAIINLLNHWMHNNFIEFPSLNTVYYIPWIMSSIQEEHLTKTLLCNVTLYNIYVRYKKFIGFWIDGPSLSSNPVNKKLCWQMKWFGSPPNSLGKCCKGTQELSTINEVYPSQYLAVGY